MNEYSGEQPGAVTSFALDSEVRRADQAQPAVDHGRRAVSPGGRRHGQERPRVPTTAAAAWPCCRSGPTASSRRPRISSSTRARSSTRSGRAARTPTRSTSTRPTASPWSPTSASTGSLSTSSTRPSGKLTPNDPPATKVKNRSGPRHFAFHPDGKHAYVINEINCTVTRVRLRPRARHADRDPDHTDDARPRPAPALDRRGRRPPVGQFPLRLEPRSRQPGRLLDRAGDRPPDGRRVRADRRQERRATSPSIRPARTCSPKTKAPDTIVVFKVDPDTGALEPTGQKVDVPKPVCVKFVPVAE